MWHSKKLHLMQIQTTKFQLQNMSEKKKVRKFEVENSVTVYYPRDKCSG